MALSSHPRSAIPQGRVRGPPPQLAGQQLCCPDATPMQGRETSRDTTEGPLQDLISWAEHSDPFHTYLPTYLPYLWETKKEITRWVKLKVGYYTN